MRRTLRTFSSVLIATGILLIADGAVTLAWQEPLSWLYATIEQNQLNNQLHQLDHAPPTPNVARALAAMGDARERIAFLARQLWVHAREGQAIGRIQIPKISADYVIVQGTQTDTLKNGPGHYPATPMPGMPGTVAIAGHRTTYLAPFRHLDALRGADTITLRMPYGIFTYDVQSIAVVLPTDLAVLKPQGYDRLVLSACTPLYSASHRIIAFARLVETQPAGAVVSVPGASSAPLFRPSSTQAAPLVPLPPATTKAPPLHALPSS